MKIKLTYNGKNGMGMKERKNTEVVEQAHSSKSTTNLYSANTREVSTRLRDSKGMVWWKGEKSIVSISSLGSFREILFYDGISPKRGGRQLGPLDACQKGR